MAFWDPSEVEVVFKCLRVTSNYRQEYYYLLEMTVYVLVDNCLTIK